MIIRSPGTTIPGAPNRPEYLKAHVYLPPMFLSHNPDIQRILFDMVQQYIEVVGTRTVEAWITRARNMLGFSLNQSSTFIPNANPTSTSFPSPKPKTSHYIFLGQRQQTVEEIPSSVRDGTDATLALSQESYTFEEFDDSFYTVADLTEQVAYLKDRNLALEAHNAQLTEELADAQNLITSLKTQHAASSLTSLRSRAISPTTPSHSATPFRHSTRVATPSVTTPKMCTPNGHLFNPVTPTRSHKSPSPMTFQSPTKSAAASSSSKVPTPADQVEEIEPTILVAQTLANLNLGHLTDEAISILSNWAPAKMSDGLVSLGISKQVAALLISILDLKEDV